MEKHTVASSLLEAARETSAPKDVLADLFPIIFTVSKRMSGRAISEFLATNHNISISQATIARALKDPKPYVAPFAKNAFESADTAKYFLNLTDVYELLDGEAFVSFLLDKKLQPSEERTSLQNEFEMDFAREALEDLRENWFKVSPEFRAMCSDEIKRLKEEKDAR